MSILELDQPEAKPLILGPALAGTLMTPEEFDQAGEADDRFTYELIHGVLVVAPPPLEEERGPNEELAFLLHLYRTQHPQGCASTTRCPNNIFARPATAAELTVRSGPGWAGLLTPSWTCRLLSPNLSPR